MSKLLTTCEDAFRAVTEARAAGKVVGLVPTMGALHDGHLSLVRAANDECDFTVATIFVNPTQFGPREDFGKYPRSLDADLALLAANDVDLVFAPSRDEMYAADFSTYVEPPQVATPLEGQCRLGHFRGVATVVLKLFNIIPAHFAYFGQKDFQQALVIRRMAADFNLPMRICVCPILREPDGLAMSSRNRYLAPAERQQALALSRALRGAAKLVSDGEHCAATVKAAMLKTLGDAGIERIDYVALADPDTLAEVSELKTRTVALIAAFVGATRLIDNEILLSEQSHIQNQTHE
jgi:pantoate--beta-alanine ligase